MSENAATRALEIVLRREYENVQKHKNPFTREMAQKWFENKMRKIPKTSARVVSVVKNVSANKAALAALKRRLDVETVKKHYKPEFFFDLLRNAPQNANAMNAMLHLTTRRMSPERLLRDLLTYDVESFPAMPMAVARILALYKIPIEKLVRMVVEKGNNNNSRYAADAAASDDLLAIFKAVERSTKKRIVFSRVRASDMFVLLVDRSDEFLESVVENDDQGIESMDVLALLAFMIRRGAPRPPVEEILRYALHYEEELGFDEWTVPQEFYALLHVYENEDRAALKDATILPRILELYAAMHTDDVLGRSADVRRILDRIVLPKKSILDMFFETFSRSESKPSIPAGDIGYLLARGAIATKKTVAAFEKYAKRLERGNVANISNAYRSVLRALNDAGHLKNYKPFSNVFKNVVDNVRKIRVPYGN